MKPLLWNMMGGSCSENPLIPQTGSKNNFYHKWESSSREEGKQEHTLEPPKGDYYGLSSDDSLSPWRKKLRNDDNLQGEFQKIKSPTYEGEMNIGEKAEEWVLGMSK